MSKIENIFKDEEEWERHLESISPDRAKGYDETERRIEQMEESIKRMPPHLKELFGEKNGEH